MPSEDSESVVPQEVADLMRAVMVETALYHESEHPYAEIDPFSASILEDRGLLTVTEVARPLDILMLANPDAESRMPAPPGPYVFVKEADRVSVLDPAELLADAVVEYRLAALRYFDSLPQSVLATRSRRVMEEARPQIASDDRSEWFVAAKGVYEMLRSDVYLTLAGFRQCSKMEYTKGVNQFLPRLLRPEAALLSSVDLECWDPSEEPKPVDAVIRRLEASRSLHDLLADYYRQLGHLPFCGAVGLGAVLGQWMEAHAGEKCWDIVWAWAEECQSPVARYHACVAFLSNPLLVPEKAEGFLWSEVGDIVNSYKEESPRTRWAEAWAIRDELALHFGNDLECLLPGLPSERLMVLAWWLTERICETLPPSPGYLKKIRESVLANELRRSTFMNNLTHPPVGPSSLRYMTRLVRRVWSASVLCELGESQWLFNPTLPPTDVGHGIDSSLVHLLVLGYPRPVSASPKPVYAFDRPLGPIATAWMRVSAADEQSSEPVDPAQMLRMADEASSPSALPGHVSSLADGAPGNHLRAAHFLRHMAHFDPAAAETLWKLFNENERWHAVFANVDKDALGVLFEALTELQVQRGGNWRTSLAHMCAIAACDASDPERRRLLFTITFFASLHCGGVSAIDRLIHGQHGAEFATCVSKWADQVIPALGVLTPWAAAQVRAVLASLALDEV